MEEKNNSVYVETVDVSGSSGVLTKQYSLNLSKWNSKDFDNYKDGAPVREGYTCQITVNRFGSNPKSNFINIDPSDDNLKSAILSMYAAYDAIVK